MLLLARFFSEHLPVYMNNMIYFSEEYRHTADFLERFDKLFNTFNSRTMTSASQYQHAFSSSSGHIEFLRESEEWLKTVKCKSKFWGVLYSSR